jgi:hypothetical protein
MGQDGMCCYSVGQLSCESGFTSERVSQPISEVFPRLCTQARVDLFKEICESSHQIFSAKVENSTYRLDDRSDKKAKHEHKNYESNRDIQLL